MLVTAPREDRQAEQCVACGGALAFYGTRVGYVYARCIGCRTIQLSPFPSQEALDRAYREEYATSGHYGSDPESMLRAAKPFYEAVLRELRRSTTPSGAVLDVGCGWGGMCRLLREQGYDYLGVDFDSQSLEYCRAAGLNVRASDIAQLVQEDERYSAVLLVTVFEHLADHGKALQQLSNLLMPGGVLVLLIPTARLFGILGQLAQLVHGTQELPALHTTFAPPWHTTIFSISGARTVLARHGFVLERIVPAPSGSGSGALRVLQLTASIVAVGGARIFGEAWPLVLNHILVCRPHAHSHQAAQAQIRSATPLRSG